MRAVQGHPHHLDLWMDTAVWSRTVSQVVLTCTVHLTFWRNPQTWGEDQGVWFGIDPWCCSERRNVKHTATVWRRGFQQFYHEGKQQHAKGLFFWVVTNAIPAIKNMVCFDVAAVLGKEESTSLRPLSHPSPSQSVTKMHWNVWVLEKNSKEIWSSVMSF